MNVKYKATRWIRLSDIPSAVSYVKIGTRAAMFWMDVLGSKWIDKPIGVYQVSLTKPKEVVHKDICYNGKSECIPKRISDLRTAAGAGNKTAHHMCGVYIREEGINIDDVFVRCLVPDNGDTQALERWLQSEHKKLFGYKVGYAWEEASGGHKSCRIQTQMSIKRLSSLEACMKIQKVLNERIEELKNGK